MGLEPRRPLRLLVVMPSWLGDCVMATPLLRHLRRSLPGCFIGALVRPGMDELLDGAGFFDEVHVERASGVMGPKHAAAKIRPRRYDTALLLTNSFSTALCTRIAGISRRIGFDRDARGFLLTDRVEAPRTPGGAWLPIPAANYYWRLATILLDSPPGLADGSGRWTSQAAALPQGVMLELGVTPAQVDAARRVLHSAGVGERERLAILNPGGNNTAKRWPADRFAALAMHLERTHGLRVLVNGSPGERDLCHEIAAQAGGVVLPDHGVTIGSLKGIVRRGAIMVTNDTGPRHIAAAFGVPLVSLFGPTDPRWTTIPTRAAAPEEVLVADPTLPPEEVADDHPVRCRIDRIPLEMVIATVDRVLGRGMPGDVGGGG
ncbi:MAG: glycosyltransferase family 9 protein [Phycisphaerales bacterium]|nr:glycosyltransferase family 9 protein [Phycisphaerales bacterium]